MLTYMPSLGNTPVKNTTETTRSEKDNVGEKTISETKENENRNTSEKNAIDQHLSFKNSAFSSSASNQEKSSESTTEKDNPSDVHELLVVSSTVKSVTRKELSGAEKKRAKMRREFIANLVMATPDDLENPVQKEENSFFDKLRDTLASDDYQKFINMLGHYVESSGNFLELYENVQSILSPKYEELAEEFYLFLTHIQTHKVGQLMSYFRMKDVDKFIKKLKVYFKDQPTQRKKIMKSLVDLSENPDITIKDLKNSIVPLFKGNVALTDWFLQIFPCERPPKIRPHEVIDISKEMARQPGEDICEIVILVDPEDLNVGSSCICTCHNVEDLQFKSRLQHCKNCGSKFIQEKTCLQTKKALPPAAVSLITNPEKDHSKRLTPTRKKRSDTSPSKQTPLSNEDSQPHEVKHSNDDEMKNQKTKTPGKLKPEERDRRKPKPKEPSKRNQAKVPESSTNRQNKKKPPVEKTEHKPGSTAGQLKRLAEQPEVEYTEPPEVSSHHSGESRSARESESSRDITNTDDEDSSDCENVNNAITNTDSVWTREEDKIILQTFRQGSENDETFKRITEVLKNRSAIEVKNRFHKLMSLLQQMASN